jgi:hypothetical protein
VTAEAIRGQDVEFVASLDIGDRVNSIFLADNYAFLAAETLGLQIVDISTPQEPEIIGDFYPPGIISDVFIQGDFAYLANGSFGLIIADVSDPAEPDMVGLYQTEGFSRIYVSEDFAYVADSYGDFCHIIDVSDPTDPFYIGELGEGRGALVPDSLAYLIFGSCVYPFDCIGGFFVFDISDIENPEELGFYWGWTPGLDISVISNLAYLVGGGHFIYDFGQLQIIDITDPGNPELLGDYYSEDVIRAVAVQRSHAYLAAEVLIIVNIDDPHNPLFATTYPAQGNDVAVDGDYIYLAEGTAFTILRYTTTAIDKIDEIPLAFSLAPAYPNPFNASTTIRYDLPKQSDIIIAIFDLLGRKVETLMNGIQPPGSHSVVWDAKDAASGVYFYRIEAEDYTQTRKCVLLR